jgi:hypothetical protein
MGDTPSKWIERVKAVEVYHKNQLRENPKWTLRNTADDLKRSIGRISEDLMLASFMKTHPKVETFENVIDAVNYCKELKKQIKLRT